MSAVLTERVHRLEERTDGHEKRLLRLESKVALAALVGTALGGSVGEFIRLWIGG